MWYVVVRKDNGYPLLIYPDEEKAKGIAEANNELYVKVEIVKQETKNES
jgi:hypothetical protein